METVSEEIAEGRQDGSPADRGAADAERIGEGIDAMIEEIFYLEMRWQDECEYEDWKDYRREVKAICEDAGLRFVGCTQRFKITVERGSLRATIQITRNGCNVKYAWNKKVLAAHRERINA